MPQRRVPRNFTLDPSVYGAPAKEPLFQFYPVLQGATVLTAFFFIVAVALEIFMMPTTLQSTASVPTEAESAISIVQESVMDAEGDDASDEAVSSDLAVGEAEPMESMADETMEEEAAEEDLTEEAVAGRS